MPTEIPQESFYACLQQWFYTDIGRYESGNVVFNVKDDINSGIKGWRQYIQPVKISEVASDGPQYLDDIRDLEDKFGFDDTYSESQQLLDYEQYVTLLRETFTSVGLSLVAVLLVVMFVTGSVPVTLLVVFAIVLVDVFLLALVYYWDLTMNSIVTVFLVIGLGLSVDYSAHIAHTYLIVEAPETMSTAEKRHHKASVAISSMGSSVIHGGFSTFLAVITLGSAKTYVFKVMFKTFFGIVVFGMANGFILLPIIFSFIGPTPNPEEKHAERERRFSRRRSTLRPEQIAAMVAAHGLKDDGEKGKSDIEMRAGTPVTDNSQVNITDNSQAPLSNTVGKSI